MASFLLVVITLLSAAAAAAADESTLCGKSLGSFVPSLSTSQRAVMLCDWE